MGSKRIKEIRSQPQPDPPKAPTLLERVVVLEEQVAKILQVREVGYGVHLIESCEAMAAARRQHDQDYADAGGRRLARLRQFLGTLVRHPSLALSASELWGGYGEWLRHQVFPAGAIVFESFADALVLQSAAIEVLGTNGLVGVGILPDHADRALYIAELDRQEAERKRLAKAENDRLRGVVELHRIQADKESRVTQMQVNRALADAELAEQHKARHPELVE